MSGESVEECLLVVAFIATKVSGNWFQVHEICRHQGRSGLSNGRFAPEASTDKVSQRPSKPVIADGFA